MAEQTRVTLARDAEAIEIPGGWPVKLKAGAEVIVTQALGDTFTVMTEEGALARVRGDDADALGLPPPRRASSGGTAAATLEEQVWEELGTVYDPEIPVNVVELGLIYGVQLEPNEGTGRRVHVRMTMTAPGCGMGDVLKDEIERKLAGLPGVSEVEVEIVLDPPWDPSLMSDEARLLTGLW